MDYVTEQFNEQRLVPSRALKLPLCVVQQNADRHTPPELKNGVLYKIKVGDNLKAYREDDFSLLGKNASKSFIIGGFGYTNDTLLIENEAGESNICKIKQNTLEVVEEFDLGIIHSLYTFVGKHFYIVACQEKRSWLGNIKLARKNFNENKLAWQFKPADVIKAFSVTEDEDIVIVTDHSGGISALDIETGQVLWQKDVDTIGVLTEEEIEIKNQRGTGKITDNPHIYKDVLVMGYLYNYIIGLDIVTGEVKWKRKFDDSNVGRLTVNDKGVIYFLDAWQKQSPAILYTIDCLTGESIKELTVDREEITLNRGGEDFIDQFDSATYSDVTRAHFWGVTSPGLLYAINLETGQIDWHYDLGNGLPHVPMFICNNRLYVQTLTEQFIFEGQGGYIPD